MKESLLVLTTLVAISSARMGGFIAGGFRINPGFSCEGRLYGFYADVDNDCRAYHVCEPVEDEFGVIVETAHYTFMCGQKTIFDQEQMLCQHRAVAYPCANAASLYEETNLQLRQEIEAKEQEAKLKKAVVLRN